MRHSATLTLGLLALLAAGCSHRPGEGAPRSLLLVTIDTVRADHVGAYGDRAAETPSLDRLAREGVRFAAASSPVPLTLPAHSSLLSGLLPPHHGVRNNGGGALPEGTPTLATVLAARGYRTGAFVGAFVLDHRFGLARGFATYDDEIERDPHAGPVLEAERPGSAVVDRALAWLGGDAARDAAAGHPFFLWVHMYDAHAPYTPPSPYRERHPGRPYDGEIASVDAQIGRLLAELDRRGLAASTVVAVAADHGEGLGEHGELTHGLLLYEPTLHVPLLVRAPGLRAGWVVRTPVSLVDVAPTLAGLLRQPFSPPAPAGAARPVDGRNLSRALLAGEQPPPEELYAETRYPEIFGWTPLAALRRRDFKYIQSARPELYDLEHDPGETRNMVEMPADDAAAPSPAALSGFAARLAAIEAGAVAPPRGGAVDAEARARLASLGYATGGPAKPAPPTKTPAPAGRPGGPEPRRMAELFRRYSEAHDRLQEGGAAAPSGARALNDLAALVAADPHNPVFRGELARAWRQRGDFARAVPLYRQAAADAPEDPEAWYNLSSTLADAGQPAAARAAIERAIHLDPSRPEAHNTLGIVQLAAGKPEEARREFAVAAALDPRNATALNNLGNVLRGLGRPDEAMRAYQRALAVAPRYAELLNGLGTLEVERDRPAAALSYFERALQLAPAYHEVRLNQGIAHELAGEADAAAAAYRDFLAATSGEPQFAEQRRAAERLLARLAGRRAAAVPGERR